jgi:hypothetical protein
VHVDRARAEKELVGNLAVRASHGDQAQDLELSSCQAALLQAAGGPAAEALVDPLAGGREIRGGAVGEGGVRARTGEAGDPASPSS